MSKFKLRFKTILAFFMTAFGLVICWWCALLASFTFIFVVLVSSYCLFYGVLSPILITVTTFAALWAISFIGIIIWVELTWKSIVTAYKSYGKKPDFKLDDIYASLYDVDKRIKLKYSILTNDKV